MRILHFSTSDIKGGAARGSYWLHRSLCEQGIDSVMLVARKYSDDDRVIPLNGKTARFVERARDALDPLPLRRYEKTNDSFWTVGWVPRRLAGAVEALKPDLVHLHWMGGGFVPTAALKDIPAPLVWTLRDMWAFTGGCHYTAGCAGYRWRCGECPQLRSTQERDLSRKVWEHKLRSWEGLDLWLVPISTWLDECVQESPLLHGVPSRVIPNGVDDKRFRPFPKDEARAAWGLAPDRQYILFGAVGALKDERKGFPQLADAARDLAASCWTTRAEMLVFGDLEPETSPDLGLKTHFLGHIDDDKRLAQLYAAADVMVVPSLQEAFGKTLIEAMACGTPVVAFDSGGPVDIVEHRETGYLAQSFDANSLARGIAWCLDVPGRAEQMGRKARKCVEQKFDMSVVADQYRDLYSSILERRS